MLLVRSEILPDGPDWTYELKLDGHRALATRTHGTVHLRSRNNKSFNGKYPAIVRALAHLPDETEIDGDKVGLDNGGQVLPSASARMAGGGGRLQHESETPA